MTGPAGRGIPVKVDLTRNIASEGTVSVVDLDSGKVTGEILVGLHPSSLAATPDGRYVTVANANSDTVSVINVAGAKVVETISTRPNRDLPFGSAAERARLQRRRDAVVRLQRHKQRHRRD